MKKAKLIISIAEILIGITLCVCNFLDVLDEFWSGFGASFIVIGVLFLLRSIKYRTNKDYKEKVDIQNSDERNRFLSLKAWSWAGYLFVIIAALATIIFKVVGREDLMMLSSGSVCLVVLLYWISYTILRKKY